MYTIVCICVYIHISTYIHIHICIHIPCSKKIHPFTREIWLIQNVFFTWDMTDSDVFMHVPWLIGVRRDSFQTYSNVLTHVPRLIRVWRDSSRRIQTCSCMCFSSFVCVYEASASCDATQRRYARNTPISRRDMPYSVWIRHVSCVYEATASRHVPPRRCVRNALIYTFDMTDSDVFRKGTWHMSSCMRPGLWSACICSVYIYVCIYIYIYMCVCIYTYT